jgi:hypothetical protein
VCIQSGADGHDGDGEGNGDGNADGDSKGTESTYSSRLVGYVNINVKISTALMASIGQSFQKLSVFHRPKASGGKLYSSQICFCMFDLETC